MTRLFGAVLAVVLVCGLSGPIRAEEAKDANAILDKAIKAIGGEEKLSKIKAASWKTKGTITFNGNEREYTGQVTAQGLDHFRQESESEFNGNKFRAVLLLDGDKGVRMFGENRTEMDKAAVANQQLIAYLTVIPITILPLKSKDFKVETIGEEMVGGKPAVGLKVTVPGSKANAPEGKGIPADSKATAPEGKDFKLYFDKESGLPVKVVAKVAGLMGGEATQETTFSDYKEMAGIQKATKIVTKRNGEKFREEENTEFKILDKDKVDPKTFTETQ
jgi:outer membrane lipoprotein-sorting protein